jgi:hypothetical protein
VASRKGIDILTIAVREAPSGFIHDDLHRLWAYVTETAGLKTSVLRYSDLSGAVAYKTVVRAFCALFLVQPRRGSRAEI